MTAFMGYCDCVRIEIAVEAWCGGSFAVAIAVVLVGGPACCSKITISRFSIFEQLVCPASILRSKSEHLVVEMHAATGRNTDSSVGT